MSIDSQEFRELLRIWDSVIPGVDDEEEVTQRLIAHIDAWGVRLAGEAKKESARLTFMIDQECQIEHIDIPGAASLYRVRWPWLEEHMKGWSRTGREAIDAAMRAKEPPCGS